MKWSVLLITVTMLAALPIIGIGVYLIYLGSCIQSFSEASFQILERMPGWLNNSSAFARRQAMLALGIIVLMMGFLLPMGIWLIMFDNPSGWMPFSP
ncbi:MAG: hypothetical protein D6690_01340 [Nitrospirae bacterium]|nr:MAG: hypothetical protein D6690_01340 [Nitrospirota bacterium]